MVLPDHLSHYAGHGHVAPIKAWLNEGGDVNERDRNQNTMLIICTGTPYTRGTASQIELARLLIEHGADANICASENPWKQYCRRDHKQILRLRSLITRGRARERLAATPAIKFILRRADNGIVWTILSFWRAAN